MTKLDSSLAKITKGAGIAFFGSLIGLGFGFLGRVMVARIGTEAEYGVFSLAFVVLNICAVIATLGLQQGATRSIAYARGKNDWERVQQLIPASIQFGLLASILLCITVFFTSDLIATKIFHDAALAFPLKVFAFGIPFFTLLNVFVSIFRGFDDVKPKVYFQNILRSVAFPLLLLPMFFLNLSFDWVFYAFLASFVISCLVLIIYAAKRLPSPIKISSRASANPVARELFFFSLPLFGVAMLGQIRTWIDTLMLGFFETSGVVGLYNASLPLAQILRTPLAAMLLIYTPTITGLYAQGAVSEIKRNYYVLVKWLCSATLPLFLIILLFPETILNFFFGANYIPAANALRILSLGFIINNIFGPNYATLIALGRPRFILWISLAAAGGNVLLNAIFIPSFGIVGAAIATTSVFAYGNLLHSWKLYSLIEAQPLSKNLGKPIVASSVVILLVSFISKNFFTVTYWMLPLLFIICYGIYGLALLFTRSFDQEDISFLLAVEKRVGVNLSFVKRILQRFL